jgi:predicted RNA-binding Zn-ribbon protein involved in translation (DUF1610 family)
VLPYQQASEETITKGAEDAREVVMMINAQTKETVAIKQCPTCAGELLARDRFCRHCGVNQNDRYVTAALTSDLNNFDTRPLGDDKATYQSLSGTLVNIVAQGLSAKSLSHRAGRGSTRLVAVIATVPIWLLIVLLSPVEAYAAVRTITKRL